MNGGPIKPGMTPAAPGDFIREEIFSPLGLSISKAAEVLEMRRPTLSNICNDKARLTPDTALRIEKAFGVSMELLLRMQASHEAAKERKRAKKIRIKKYEAANG